MRGWLIALLIAAGAVTASAQSYCGQRTDNVTNALGQAIPNISVTYYSQPTNALATVYSSTSCGIGTQNGVICSGIVCGNPQVTNGLGQTVAYLPPGLYTVVYAGAQIQTQTYVDQNIPQNGSAQCNVVSASVINCQQVISGINGGLSTQSATATTVALKQDARRCNDITATNGSATISSAGCSKFTSGDVGKVIMLWTATGARQYTGYISSVQSLISATMSSVYTGITTAANGPMILGTDDGNTLNLLIQTIPANSSKGALSLSCKPIITTVTINFGVSRDTQVEGCGMGSGILTGLAAGAPSGTVIIWAGAAHPVTTSISSGHFVTLTDPLGHGFSSPAICASANRLCLVDLQGCAQSGLNGTHLVTGPVSSITQLAFYTASTSLTTDSCYIPASDVIKLNSEVGTTIRNVSIQGSDQPATFPRALIDMTDGTGTTTNGFNKIENVFLGNLGEQGFQMPGNITATTSTAQFAILGDPVEEVNDKNQFENMGVYNVDVCYASEHSQDTDWTFSGVIHCAFSGAGFAQLNGTWWKIAGTFQSLQNGVGYLIANAAHISMFDHTEETDGPATINAPQIGGPADVAGTSMLAEFTSASGTGLPGGTLSIDHGVYPASSALPSNGDFVWTSLGSSSSLILNDFTLEYDIQAPPVVTPLVDFSVTAGGQRNVFECHGCSGFQGNNFNVTSTGSPVQMTVVCNDSPAGPGLGESGCNWLQQGDAAGVDDFRIDFAGKLRVLGAKVMIPQLGVPVAPSVPVCQAAGSTSYYYKYTAVSGGLETTPSAEYTATSCASSVSSTNYILGTVWPVVGADSYKIYRGTSPGGELYAFTLPANTGYNTSTEPGGGTPYAFKDTVTTPSGALPTVNATGEAQLTYILPTLSTVTLGNACPVNGVIWEGIDGSVGQCESNVISTWPSVASPPTYVMTTGAGAGTGGSVGVVCLNSGFERCTTWAGTVILTTGASGMAIGQQVVFTYTSPNGYVHPCTFTPTNAITYNLGTVYTVISATQFAVSTTVAPGAGATLGWSYSCPVIP